MNKKEFKIILIRPTFGSRFQITPPLSLGYLSSNLKKNGYSNIELLDGTLLQLSPEEASLIAKKKRPNLIGIQIYTGSQNWAREFVSNIKGLDAVVVVGGPHISSLKDIAVEHIGAHYGIAGEGEESLVALTDSIIDNIDNKYRIPGLIFKENDLWKYSEESFAQLKNVNKLPAPDWDLLNIHRYYKHMEGATVPLKGKKPIPILTSRGCPYQCTFCASQLTFLKKMRFLDIEKVVDELVFLKKEYGIDEFFVTDDNLTINMERAERFFDLLIDKKLNLHWRAPNGLRADKLSEKLIKKMKDSGCYFVGIGVETGSQKIMKSIKKSLDLKSIEKVLPLLRKNKIKSSGFFMVGLIDEKLEDIKKTLSFIKKSKFDRIQVSIYTPYPGSEDFNKIFSFEDKQKYTELVKDYLYEGLVLEANNNLSSEIIHKYQKRMVTSFFLQPRILIDLLLNLRITQIAAILKHPIIKRWFSKKHDSYLDDIR